MKIHDSGTASEASGGPQVAAFGRARRGGLSQNWGFHKWGYPTSWMVRKNPNL